MLGGRVLGRFPGTWGGSLCPAPCSATLPAARCSRDQLVTAPRMQCEAMVGGQAQPSYLDLASLLLQL